MLDRNPPIGVLLSQSELNEIRLLLISLRADDLILEETRREALATINQMWLDCLRVTSPKAHRHHLDPDAL